MDNQNVPLNYYAVYARVSSSKLFAEKIPDFIGLCQVMFFLEIRIIFVLKDQIPFATRFDNSF